MNSNEYNQAYAFLDYLAANSFIPLTLQPVRITSNTFIDNIFSNVVDPDIILGNLSAIILLSYVSICNNSQYVW